MMMLLMIKMILMMIMVIMIVLMTLLLLMMLMMVYGDAKKRCLNMTSLIRQLIIILNAIYDLSVRSHFQCWCTQAIVKDII